MRHLKSLSTLAILLSGALLHSQSLELELLPKGRPFLLTFSDPREIRMALLFEGESRLQALVGNYFSLFALKNNDPEDWKIHFGVEGAGYFSLRQAGSRFPLEHTDGLLGLYLEGAKKELLWQFRYQHISAHLSDGFQGVPIAYSREFLVLRAGWKALPGLHVYAGPRLIVNSIPKVPVWAVQFGGSYFSPWGLGKFVPFAATDFQWREESSQNPSFNLQLGVALNNPPAAYRSFRFFYAYYTGVDFRGQFFTQSRTSHSFGIEMQI